MKNNIKIQIEEMCKEFLEQFAKENDKNLNNGGGFADIENFYEWNDNTFIINLFSISQDDFFEKIELFKKVGSELKKKIELLVEVKRVFYANDCPIIFFEFNN